VGGVSGQRDLFTKGSRMEIKYEDYFSYHPGSPSFLICKKNIGRKRSGEFPAVTMHPSGYLVITVLNKKFQLHRFIWGVTRGEIPDGFCIDHIDGNKTNNLIENLRLATLSQNSWNRRKQSNGDPYFPKGICAFKSGGYVAHIQRNGRRWHKYSYDLSELMAWLNAKRADLHGSYANYG
jgi:hypothetical protein